MPRTRMATPKLARVDVERGGYPASRTSMDLPISQLVLRTAEVGARARSSGCRPWAAACRCS